MHTPSFRGPIIAMLALLLGAGGMMFSPTPSYADVKHAVGKWGPPNGIDRYPDTNELTLYGTISKADADYFTHHAADYEMDNLTVYLDSAGGDVDAAMQIGRILRRNEVSIMVGKNAKCYSSCALIYIAGVGRYNSGTIGLHRPYFASAPQSRQSIERRAPLMLQQLKAYVQEMGITDNFYQEMVNTEPSAIKLYVGENINTIVPKLDPTFDEVEIAYEARAHGVDTAEMRRRKADAGACPIASEKSYTCAQAAEWGLSQRVWLDRTKKQATQCKLSDEELHTLKSIKAKERRDHPIFLKSEACERDIMVDR